MNIQTRYPVVRESRRELPKYRCYCCRVTSGYKSQKLRSVRSVFVIGYFRRTESNDAHFAGNACPDPGFAWVWAVIVRRGDSQDPHSAVDRPILWELPVPLSFSTQWKPLRQAQCLQPTRWNSSALLSEGCDG